MKNKYLKPILSSCSKIKYFHILFSALGSSFFLSCNNTTIYTQDLSPENIFYNLILIESIETQDPRGIKIDAICIEKNGSNNIFCADTIVEVENVFVFSDESLTSYLTRPETLLGPPDAPDCFAPYDHNLFHLKKGHIIVSFDSSILISSKDKIKVHTLDKENTCSGEYIYTISAITTNGEIHHVCQRTKESPCTIP